MTDYEDEPSEETMLKQLEIQWQDHFQTRSQTWKPLEIEAAMFLAVIAADIKLDNLFLLLLFCILLITLTTYGMALTIHHSKVQSRKFKYIYRLEEKLNLHKHGYMDDIPSPEKSERSSVFSGKLATPAFILTMHILVMVAALMYILGRVSSLSVVYNFFRGYQ